MKELLEKLKKRQLREAVVSYPSEAPEEERIHFRLRELPSASQVGEMLRKCRLYSAPIKDFPLPSGEKITLTPELAEACIVVEACLIEPQLSFHELLELSQHTGFLIYRLKAICLDLLGFTEAAKEEIQSFFAPPSEGGGET